MTSRAGQRRRSSTLLVAVALVASALAPVPIAWGEASPAWVAEQRLVVGWDGPGAARDALEALAAHGLTVERRLYGDRSALVRVPEGATAEDLAARLARAPGIAWAEPDRPVAAVWTPDDPRYADGSQWPLGRIQAEYAWDVARGAGAVIAVVDTGVDLDHEDLVDNLWVNDAEVPSNGRDDDGNGFIDDVSGWDFINADPLPDDDNGHGTHCAGIAAGVGGNALGIIGVAPEARIMPVKVLDSRGSGTAAGLAEGIDYAVASGADVVSVSVGGLAGSTSLQTAVTQARAAGVPVFAAAGNEGGGTVLFPAAYGDSICVGATDGDDVRTTYSNYGSAMDIVAPGGTAASPVLSTIRGSSYGTKFGTSMATPHAAGAAGLLVGLRPHLSASAVAWLLQSTALDRGAAGWDAYYGWGLVRARDALDLMRSDVAAPASVATTETAPPEGVLVRIAVTDVGLGSDRVDWWLDTGATGTGTTVEVTDPGWRTLSWAAVDLAGNRESTRTLSFDVTDTLPPTTTSDARPVYYGSEASIRLTASDRGAGVAGTYWALDDGPFQSGTTITISSAGDRTLRFYSVDALGHEEPVQTVSFRVYGTADAERLSGDDRYQTAVAVARSAFGAGSAPIVVLASGQDFPDALAAAGLAGTYRAPVLLVQRDRIPVAVLNEMGRLGTTKALLVGGAAAVGPGVESALAAAGITTERIGGEDRYHTAELVAARMRAATGSAPRAVFVVRGDAFADALAVAPGAYRMMLPVLLTRPDALPLPTRRAIEASGDAIAIVAGGEAAVGPGVVDGLAELLGAQPTRLGGETRYATAARVAGHLIDRGWASGSYIGIATGSDYPDALSGGTAAGSSGGVVLLTRPETLVTEAYAFIEQRGQASGMVRVLGGPSAVSPVVLTKIRQIPLL